MQNTTVHHGNAERGEYGIIIIVLGNGSRRTLTPSPDKNSPSACSCDNVVVIHHRDVTDVTMATATTTSDHDVVVNVVVYEQTDDDDDDKNDDVERNTATELDDRVI